MRSALFSAIACKLLDCRPCLIHRIKLHIPIYFPPAAVTDQRVVFLHFQVFACSHESSCWSCSHSVVASKTANWQLSVTASSKVPGFEEPKCHLPVPNSPNVPPCTCPLWDFHQTRKILVMALQTTLQCDHQSNRKLLQMSAHTQCVSKIQPTFNQLHLLLCPDLCQ